MITLIVYHKGESIANEHIYRLNWWKKVFFFQKCMYELSNLFISFTFLGSAAKKKNIQNQWQVYGLQEICIWYDFV